MEASRKDTKNKYRNLQKDKERENIKNRYRFMLEDQKEKLTKYQRNFYAVIVNKKELHASKNILF